jgi:hypothetical protein
VSVILPDPIASAIGGTRTPIKATVALTFCSIFSPGREA